MMLSPHKIIPFTLRLGLIALNLLPPLPISAHAHSHTLTLDKSKVNPEVSYQIKVHGFLMWVSVGLLMPLSILVKRMPNPASTSLKIIFYIHAATQVLAVLIAAGGGIMSIKYLDNSFNNNHQRIGLAFYGLIWLQTLVSIFRPPRGSKGRSIWFVFHWLVGIMSCLLGTINIFTGLQAYNERTSKDVRIWTIIFMVEMCLVVFVYLLQEKWHYINQTKIPAEQGNIT